MNKFKYANFFALSIMLFFLLPFTSCKKDTFTTSGTLDFSNDTLTFDTLFTTLGSTTKFFTIRNTSKQAVKISNIRLGNGSSFYRINIDGDNGVTFKDIEIPAKDSIYIFVEVTINPNASNLPFIILDSIQFNTNGIAQKVILQAYGQNAHFFNVDSIESNVVWENDLPYVILNYLQIKEGASLTINKGCNVYFGGGAALIVEGNLQINGTDTSNMVTFRGVRSDEDITGRNYDDFPGQYSGLFFLRNSFGDINYLKMRNSLYGINVGNIKTTGNSVDDINSLQNMALSNAPQVTIRHSKIYNNSFYGIFGFLGRIKMENSLVYNCGKNVIGLNYGGDYLFKNCTFYTQSGTYISHSKDPSFYMSNYFIYSNSAPPLYADTSSAAFVNCILYGTLDDEIVAEEAAGSPHHNYLLFTNSIVKTKLSLSNPIFNSCSISNPQFTDIYKSNYKPKSSSSANNSGIPTGLLDDIDGLPRFDPQDIGAYNIP